jgi:hypothetical protein
MLYTINKTVLTEPFKENSVKTEVKSGFATISQKHKMTGLKVLVGTPDIPAGSTVWVNADTFKQPWATRIYELGPYLGIMVPFELINAVEAV